MAAIFEKRHNTPKIDFFEWLHIQIHLPHKYASLHIFKILAKSAQFFHITAWLEVS